MKPIKTKAHRSSRRGFLIGGAAAAGLFAADLLRPRREKVIPPENEESPDIDFTNVTVPAPVDTGNVVQDYTNAYSAFDAAVNAGMWELDEQQRTLQSNPKALCGINITFRPGLTPEEVGKCHAHLKLDTKHCIELPKLAEAFRAYGQLCRAREKLDGSPLNFAPLAEVPTGEQFIDYLIPHLQFHFPRAHVEEKEVPALRKWAKDIYYATCACGNIKPRFETRGEQAAFQNIQRSLGNEQAGVFEHTFTVKPSDLVNSDEQSKSDEQPGMLKKLVNNVTTLADNALKSGVPITVTIENPRQRGRISSAAAAR